MSFTLNSLERQGVGSSLTVIDQRKRPMEVCGQNDEGRERKDNPLSLESSSYERLVAMEAV
jgi:hypothetical protein